MKLILHRMRGCDLCLEAAKLLMHWNILFRTEYDIPEQDRPYPYITIELEYEELIDWISREKIQ